MRVVIVGAGLCGIACFAHLAHALRNSATRMEIVLLNRKASFARGVAYGTHSASHLLNVPAARMSIFPERPDDFLAYLSEQGLPADPVSFVPRSHFGNYLRQRFDDACKLLPAGVKVSHLALEALDATPSPDGLVNLTLSDGSCMRADQLILAMGNLAPIWPGVFAAAVAHAPGQFVTDPWAWNATQALPETWDNVLVLGTGLTMMDVVVELNARGFTGQTTALSRRGLAPQPHRGHAVQHGVTCWDDIAHESPRELCSRLRNYAVLHPGADWRDGIASIREATPAIWNGWTSAQRRQFLRHLRPYWDTHRHRCAPFIHRQISDRISNGTLHLERGRVSRVEVCEGKVKVHVQRPGCGGVSWSGIYDAVINCTGPSIGLGTAAHPLLENLQHKSWIKPDDLGIGIQVSAQYRPHEDVPIYYLGPMLRARYWEATAVPELRLHAKTLADQIVEKLV